MKGWRLTKKHNLRIRGDKVFGYCWVDADKKRKTRYLKSCYSEKEYWASEDYVELLPAIDTSLDLFWKWVFPEVAKRLEEETVEWFSGVPLQMEKEDYVQSLLKSTLKALGVL